MYFILAGDPSWKVDPKFPFILPFLCITHNFFSPRKDFPPVFRLFLTERLPLRNVFVLKLLCKLLFCELQILYLSVLVPYGVPLWVSFCFKYLPLETFFYSNSRLKDGDFWPLFFFILRRWVHRWVVPWGIPIWVSFCFISSPSTVFLFLMCFG